MQSFNLPAQNAHGWKIPKSLSGAENLLTLEKVLTLFPYLWLIDVLMWIQVNDW